MPKKSPIEEVIPEPKDITAVAQTIDPENVNKIALRRGKVRELMRMGYEVSQIVLILDKGIKVSKDQAVKVPISETIVKNDMEYIRQEDAAKDVDFAEKRAEILDKLQYLYNRAVYEYINAKGQTKATFLNSALAVLSKITELEGVKSPEAIDINIQAQAKIAKFAAEIHKLSKDDQSVIVTAIRKVLKQREP